MNDWDYRIPADDPASPRYRPERDDWEECDRADKARKDQLRRPTMTTSEAISLATEEFVVAEPNGGFPPCTEAEQQAVRDAMIDRLVAGEFGEPVLSPASEASLSHPHQDFIDGLRNLADYIERHPHAVRNVTGVQVDVFPADKDEMLAMSRGAGRLEKRVCESWFYLSKTFGPRVKLEWNQAREKVCDRVVTGTRIEPAKPERLLPAEPEKIVEIVEWRCPDSILRPKETP